MASAILRQRVAEDLGLVPIGQDPEAHDTARIDSTFDEVYAAAKEKGLATWAASADVPTKLVPAFALIMEQALLTAYSVPESRYNRIVTAAGLDGKLGWEKLGELAVPEWEDSEDEKDY